MGNEKNEQVIFIKDLLFAALYQWRKVLIVALAFAVLIGGVVGIKQWRTATASPSEDLVQEEMAKYETQKLLLEKAVTDAENLVESQEQYNTNSTIMILDPYNVYKATIELTVQVNDQSLTGEMDPAAAYRHAYCAYLSGDQIIQTAAKAIDTENKYMRELVTFVDGEIATQSLSISIMYPTAEGAQAILDIYLDYLDQATQHISETMGKHNVNIIASSVDQFIDLTITEKQTAAQKRLEDLRVNLKEAQALLNALQVPSFGTSASIRKTVIFAILGAILGAGLVVCWAWFNHIAGGKVYSARTLTNKTGIKILGCAPAKTDKNCFDRWLKKQEGRCLQAEQLDVITASVRNYCKDAKQLLILGDSPLADQELVAQALQTCGLQILACGSLLRDASAHEALGNCDAVLLTEKCGVSNYQNVLKTISIVSDQEKTLIGCILLDG